MMRKDPAGETTGVFKLATIFSALMLAATAAMAQERVNNQDEVVNVVTGGNPEGSDEVFKIFRPETKAESLNYIVEFVELKNAAANEVAAYVDEAVQMENGLSKSLEYTDPMPERSASTGMPGNGPWAESCSWSAPPICLRGWIGCWVLTAPCWLTF